MCQLSPVPFHGGTIFCVTIENQPYTPAKPIVENMGLAWQAQAAKLSANKERWGIMMIVIPSESGEQETICIPVRKLPAFLASINPKKVRAELRERIELYQAECDDALWNYWMNGRAERQLFGNSEHLTEPVSIPDKLPTASPSITPSTVADRKPLRSLVNAWARVSGHPFDACWSQLKAAFSLTDIRDLPQEWIPDAVAWVQSKIDALPKAVPGASAAPRMGISTRPLGHPKYTSEEYAARAANLVEVENDILKLECETRDKFRKIQSRYSELTGSAFFEVLGRIPVRNFVSTDFMVDVLSGQLDNACRGMDEAFRGVRYAIRSAISANSILAKSM